MTKAKVNSGKTSASKVVKSTTPAKGAKADEKVTKPASAKETAPKDTKSTKPASGKGEKATAPKDTKETKTAKETAPVAGNFERKTYTKADLIAEYASLNKCKLTEATTAVDKFLEAIGNIAGRLEVGVNKKGKMDSDILQITGLLSIDSAFHQERMGWNNQTQKKNLIPAKFHTRITAGSVLLSIVDEKSNATLAKLNKKKK